MRTYQRTHPWIKFKLDLSQVPLELWLLLGEARSKCEHLNGIPLRPDTAARLHGIYLAKGVLATTAIEGNTLSQEEVEQAVKGTLKLPPSKEYLKHEVDNIIQACNTLFRQCCEGKIERLDVETIQRFNQWVLAGLAVGPEVIPGKLRQHDVGVARYRGAPWQDCEHLVQRLVEWLEELDERAPKSMGLATAILRAILAHLYIAWIHPFGDGNGRTARLIEFAILVQAGIPTPAAHLLSNHYNETRTEYYRQLDHASQSGGDVIPFALYAVQGFVDGLRAQIQEVRKEQIDVAWRNYVHEQFRDDQSPARVRQRRLVLDLSRRGEPVPRRKLMEVSTRVATLYATKTEKTLTRDVNALKEMGLIHLVPGGFIANTRRFEAFLTESATQNG